MENEPKRLTEKLVGKGEGSRTWQRPKRIKYIKEPLSDLDECWTCGSPHIKKIDETSYYCRDCGTITTWKDKLLNPHPIWKKTSKK